MKIALCCSIFLWIAVAAVAQPLRIAVASNAQFVAGKLTEAFRKQTGIATELIVGSSGKLTAQIEQGAPFQVFLSADMKYPEALYNKGLTTARPQVYAYGALVLWTLNSSAPDKGMNILLDKTVQKIAIANPKLAPYGEAAMQVLAAQKLTTRVQPKLVYGESIAQVNQYLLSGAAEVAFTAKAVVLDTALQGKGKWIDINPRWYRPIAQGVVIIRQKNSTQMQAAARFYQFLFSKKGREIFKKYGYR